MIASMRRMKNSTCPISSKASSPAWLSCRRLPQAGRRALVNDRSRRRAVSLPRGARKPGVPPMIIDSHCHAGQGDILTYPANTTAPLGLYLRRAARAGIERTVVMPAFHSDYAQANEQLARLVRRHAGRLIGYAFVHTRRDAGRIHSMIERAVKEWRFRGIKVHGYDSLPTREVCEAARRFRLPMIVDVVGRAYAIDQFAPQYRDVNFIIAHMGSFLDDWRAQQLVCDQLVRHPNVYADTSGIRRFDYIVQAIK